MHGSLALVRCLECGGLIGRDEMQARLAEANRGWLDAIEAGSETGGAEAAAH